MSQFHLLPKTADDQNLCLSYYFQINPAGILSSSFTQNKICKGNIWVFFFLPHLGQRVKCIIWMRSDLVMQFNAYLRTSPGNEQHGDHRTWKVQTGSSWCFTQPCGCLPLGAGWSKYAGNHSIHSSLDGKNPTLGLVMAVRIYIIQQNDNF